jgi:uncharacterized protein
METVGMEPVAFETEDGVRLFGELRHPDGPALGSAVLCHAHPRRGGSKDHPLLWAVRNELARRGFAVLAFDFRGVMRSEGFYGGGIDELRDARAAVGRAGEESAGPTFVCGWSFGASVALRLAVDDERVAGLALIGFPLAGTSPELPPPPPPERLASLRRPVLLLAGDADPFCPAQDLRGLARRLPMATVTVLKGTDHFFGRREREAAQVVGRFAESVLERPSG